MEMEPTVHVIPLNPMIRGYGEPSGKKDSLVFLAAVLGIDHEGMVTDLFYIDLFGNPYSAAEFDFYDVLIGKDLHSEDK